MNVLAPNRGESQQDVLPEAGIPTWKEELVERVRRRSATATAAKKAAAKSSNKKAKRPAAGKTKTAKAAGGPGVVVEACKS